MTDSRLTKTEPPHSAAVRALLALWNTHRGETSLSNGGYGDSLTGLADSSLPNGAKTGVSDPGYNNSKRGGTLTLWFV